MGGANPNFRKSEQVTASSLPFLFPQARPSRGSGFLRLSGDQAEITISLPYGSSRANPSVVEVAVGWESLSLSFDPSSVTPLQFLDKLLQLSSPEQTSYHHSASLTQFM